MLITRIRRSLWPTLALSNTKHLEGFSCIFYFNWSFWLHFYQQHVLKDRCRHAVLPFTLTIVGHLLTMNHPLYLKHNELIHIILHLLTFNLNIYGDKGEIHLREISHCGVKIVKGFWQSDGCSCGFAILFWQIHNTRPECEFRKLNGIFATRGLICRYLFRKWKDFKFKCKKLSCWG